MCLKLACSICNKTVSHRNSIVCAQYALKRYILNVSI